MDIAFAFPIHQWPIWVGIAAVSIAMLALAIRILDRQRHERLQRFVEAHLAPRLLLGYDARLRRPLNALTLFGFAALALALAEPHWGEAWRSSRAQTRDIMVLLDLSHSMRAEDILPSRLDRAKYKVDALMDRLPGDRFGLIGFAGAASLQAPLTSDHNYFRAVLRALDTSTIGVLGTDIAAAIDEAVRIFAADDQGLGDAARDTRAILLVSDGEQISGDAVAAARRASAHARVYTMGVGDPRGAEVEIPPLRGTRIAPGIPTTHWSVLDEETLVQIAQAGNGAYVRLEPDDWDLDQIQQRMADVAARSQDGNVARRLINRYQWPLALAIALFSAEALWLIALPHLRRRRAGRAIVPEASAVTRAQSTGESQHA